MKTNWRKPILAVLAAALLPEAAMAAFRAGYEDNPCNVTIPSVAVEQVPGSTTNHRIAVRYSFSCDNGTYYSVTLRQHRNGEASDATNPCLPIQMGSFGSPKYNEAAKTITIPNFTAGTTTCPDLTLQDAIGAFAVTPYATKATLESWSTAGDVAGANQAMQKYNPADFTLTFPYGTKVVAGRTILAGKSFYMSGGKWVDGDPQVKNHRWFAKVIYAKDPRYFALVHLLPGFTDGGIFSKPLVVGDAFDPGNQRGFTREVGAPSYRNIALTKEFSKLIDGDGPRGKGYDIFFLDFSQGAGNLLVNAGLQLKFIEWLSAQTSNKIVVGGPSMSGLIARLSLLYSLPRNNSVGQDLGRKVKGFLAIDAPMQGAMISPHMQDRMYQLKDHAAVELYDLFGYSDQIKNAWQVLRRPATYQLLYEHHYPDGSPTQAGHQAFFNHLRTLGGYRKDMPRASIAYSNFHQNGYPGNDVKVTVATLNVPGLSPRDIWTRNQDFLAGSHFDLFWNSFKGKALDRISVNSYGNPPERFKGSFVPIQSALDLATPYAAGVAPTDNYAIAANSPFNFVYYMKNPYNGYCNTSNVCSQLDAPARRATVEDRKYQHIVFDKALLGSVNAALDRIENSTKSINHDQFDDLLYFDPPTGNIHGQFSNGSGFTYSGVWRPLPLTSSDRDYLFIGDFTGDGYVDMGYLDPGHAFKISYSRGDHFLTMVQWLGPNGFGHRGGRHLVADFNGDGRDDLFFFQPGSNTLHVTLSTGSGFGGPGSGTWIGSNGFGSRKERFYSADFNGDGFADLGYFETDQSFHVNLSTGSGFGAAGSGRWLAPGYFGSQSITLYTGDFNGDGREDLMAMNQSDNSLWVIPSQGNRFGASQLWVASNAFGNVPTRYLPADLNGDGFCDLAYFDVNNGSVRVRLTNSAGTAFLPESYWILPGQFGSADGRHMVTYKKKRIVIP